MQSKTFFFSIKDLGELHKCIKTKLTQTGISCLVVAPLKTAIPSFSDTLP